jgi:HigB_toxin, RelE-like toxic component of a toxin-antitoxin system
MSSDKPLCVYASLIKAIQSSFLDALFVVYRRYRQNIANSTSHLEICGSLVKFPSADQVGKLTVFNIGGNKVRLIAAIHYNRHKVYIRAVLTHSEYDEGKWKE